MSSDLLIALNGGRPLLQAGSFQNGVLPVFLLNLQHDYGIDGSIKEVREIRPGRHFETGIGINFQLKSSSNITVEDDFLVYDIESKAYNDLVYDGTVFPNILILFVMPSNENEWLSVERERLQIRQFALWHSLKGLPQTDNDARKRIRIPLEQILTPDNLSSLMDKVKGGQPL